MTSKQLLNAKRPSYASNWSMQSSRRGDDEWKTVRTFTDLEWKEKPITSTKDGRIAIRMQYALECLQEAVDVNPHILGGIPVVEGTRYSIAQILAEMAEGLSVDEVSDDFDLEKDKLVTILHGLSICMDRPFRK